MRKRTHKMDATVCKETLNLGHLQATAGYQVVG